MSQETALSGNDHLNVLLQLCLIGLQRILPLIRSGKELKASDSVYCSSSSLAWSGLMAFPTSYIQWPVSFGKIKNFCKYRFLQKPFLIYVFLACGMMTKVCLLFSVQREIFKSRLCVCSQENDHALQTALFHI